MPARRGAASLALVAVTALASTLVIGTVAPPATAAPGAAVTYTPAQLLEAIPVAPPLTVGYRGVEQFIPRAVANRRDSRGCNLRERMIIALAAKKPKVTKGCRMTGGSWVIDNGARTVRSPRGIVIAPVIPYKQAWGAGAYAWTPAQRLAWATNTGPSRATRAKAVANQATQTLLSAETWRKTWATISFIEFYRLAIVSWCTVRPGECIDGYPGYSENQLNNVARAKEICATAAQGLANLAAWGLSLSTNDAIALESTRRVCASPITVYPEAGSYGILPVLPTSGVPAAFEPPDAPLFDGYGEPATDPIGGETFGILAPVDWPAPQVKAGALRLWDAGVSWRQIEFARGAYDWRTLDQTIARAQASAQRVMYVLGDTPAWANGGRAGNVPPTDLADAASFVRALCQRYQGSIAQIQVWNEGNILDFWTGTPQELAALTSQVKQAVDGCFPATQVVASSAGARAEGGFATRYKDYLLALRDGGWPVEAFSVHSYPKASGGPTDRVGILQQWRAMLDLVGAPDLPLFDTELNYGLAGLGQGRVAIDDATGAAWIAQSMIQSIQYGIDAQYWFLWTGDQPYDKLGIQLYSGSPQANAAWDITRDLLRFSRMQRCAQQDNLIGCQFTGAGNRSQFTIAWSTSGQAQLRGADLLGGAVCGLLDGVCQPATRGVTVMVGASPVVIR